MDRLFGPKNVAAWQIKEDDTALTVLKADYTSPPEGHVVLKVIDIAINPIDWILQDTPPPAFNVEYPAIFGRDVAGEIYEIGDGVDEFRVGQRVIANVSGDGAPAKGGFQKYVVVPKAAIAELPSEIGTSTGVVLPLGISTASAGLFQKDYLNLPYPKEDPDDLERTVLIWGGSSSVGSCAIQLAKAAGADVVTTASPANFEYVRKLGARAVFDYHDEDVEDQLVDALKNHTVIGAYHAVGGDDAVQTCARVVDRAKGKAIVVAVKGIPEEGIPSSVRTKQIGAAAIFTNEVGPYIWREFLPVALKKGTVVPAPEPLIVGEELRSVQKGLDRQKEGVSAKKVVVTNIS